jgi:hypothetical protein
MLTVHLQVLPRLRASGAIPSWRWQGQLYHCDCSVGLWNTRICVCTCGLWVLLVYFPRIFIGLCLPAKALVANQVYHMVITSTIHVNRLDGRRRIEESSLEGNPEQQPGNMEVVNPWGFCSWPHCTSSTQGILVFNIFVPSFTITDPHIRCEDRSTEF